ncbi:hypothetical protein FAI40_06255 [Acetobacteraceae bacterium]|nr:hypothetical protein FAI40_06255 [Acetobacteraceae bacterium]
MPHSSFEEIKADSKAAPYHETRPLSEVWDSAREHEEAFTFLHEIPSSIAGEKPTQVVLLIFPKITSGLLSFSEVGKVKPIFGKDHQRYPPLVSLSGRSVNFISVDTIRASCL